MLPKAAHRFEEWFQTPLREESSDPRFEVRRAHPSEFERLYDLVDEAFGVKRPRAVFDWLYRGNPAGVAHCWVVEEKATGRLVCARTRSGRGRWRTGRSPASATCLGDSGRRSAIGSITGSPRFAGGRPTRHPLDAVRMKIGWPNEKTLRPPPETRPRPRSW